MEVIISGSLVERSTATAGRKISIFLLLKDSNTDKIEESKPYHYPMFFSSSSHIHWIYDWKNDLANSLSHSLGLLTTNYFG
jgi:hypothetical protein